MQIDNFRTLNNMVVDFHELSNYLIGENNLGKSNFLDALYIVFNGKKFEDDDFFDSNNSIEIIVTIALKDSEKRLFGDNFSSEDDCKITIKYQQSFSEEFPTTICLDTDESIKIKQLRKLHFIRYESTSIPNKELKIDSSNAAGSI